MFINEFLWQTGVLIPENKVSISEDYKLNCLVLEFSYFICQVVSARKLHMVVIVNWIYADCDITI